MVLLVAKHFVHLRSLVDGHAVTDDKAGIDLPALNQFEQRLHVAHHVRLASFHRQSFVHISAHRHFVDESAVNTRDGNRTSLAACHDGLAQDSRAIRLHLEHLFCFVDGPHWTAVMCFHAHGIHAGVWADVAGHVLKKLNDIINFFIVDDFRSSFFGQFQAVIKTVNGDHAFSAEKKCAANRELSDRAAAPDRNCIAGLDIAVFRSHVTGRKDV